MLAILTRFRRRSLFVLGLLLLVLLGLAVWGTIATRQALERAEAFQFQRLRVSRLDEHGGHRFLYVTNRSPGSGERLADRFGRERGEELSFGSFDFRVEPSLGMLDLFDPSKWFRDDEVEVLAERTLEREAFVEQLREVVERSPRASLLVIVHGYREAFESALRKTAFMGRMLDLDTPVLLFDWPGNQGGGPLAAYRRAFEIAHASGPDLAAVLALVLAEVGPDSMWLVANSMGGQVVADAFSDLYADPEMADEEAELAHVVLTAPDVDQGEFDERFRREIEALSRRLTVYVSSNDRALLASRLVNRGRRRGEASVSARNVSEDQLEEALRLAALMQEADEPLTLVDVTPVNRTVNFHNFYLEAPEFFDDLFLRLTSDEPPRTRPLYPLRSAEGDVYWVLTRGR
jgi:esterase/lipase superfamily enzyme